VIAGPVTDRIEEQQVRVVTRRNGAAQGARSALSATSTLR